MLRLLGTPDFQGAPIPLERSTVLVAILVLAGDWVSRESLMALLWSDAPLEVTQVRLRQLLRRAQQFDFCAGLQIERSRLCYQSDSDLRQFKKVYEAQHWLEASKLYRGEFLKGMVVADALDLETWLQTEREALRQMFVRAVEFATQPLPDTQAQAVFLAAVQLEPLESKLVQMALQRGTADLVFSKQIYGLHEAALSTLSEKPDDQIKRLLAWAEQNQYEPFRVIPVVSDSLIGRQAELEQIEYLFATEQRLVTLLGVGGIGKTRLALEIALRSKFLGGVVFVSLVSVSKSSDLLPAIVEALGVTAGMEVIAQIKHILGQKDLLLVLDNFEHIIAAAPIVADLLGQVGALHILVTSREALNLSYEQLLEVTGFPALDDLFPFESQETTLLFERQAKRNDLHFSWRSTDLEFIGRIHKAVSGSPLGILLAAGLLRVYGLAQIVIELERNLEVLAVQPALDLPIRHRSLEAIFLTSWNLLTQTEQRVLAQLSVLTDGFEPSLATFLTGATQGLLHGLINKSLISKRGQRLFLHEVIRQYAQFYLLDEEKNQILARLFEWSFDIAKKVWDNTGVPTEYETYLAAQDEFEHIRLAIAWGLTNQPIRLTQMLKNMIRFFSQRGYIEEQLVWFSQLLTDPRLADQPALRGHCFWSQGYCCYLKMQVAKMSSHAQKGLLLAQEVKDYVLMARALRLLYISSKEQLDHQNALQYSQESLLVTQQYHVTWLEPLAYFDLGCSHYALGSWDEAEEAFTQSFLLFQQFGDQHGMATTMGEHALVFGKRHDYETERTWLLETLLHFQATQNKIHAAVILEHLGANAIRRGVFTEARRYLAQAESLAKRIGFSLSLFELLADYSYLAFREGYFEKAALLLFIGQYLLQHDQDDSRKALSQDMLKAHLDEKQLSTLKRKAAFYNLEQAFDLLHQPSADLVHQQPAVLVSSLKFSKA